MIGTALPAIAWSPLGSPAPRELTEDRLILHGAVQIVASYGNTLARRAADDSHTALAWIERASALGGVEVDGLRAALRPDDLTLLVLGPDDAVRDGLALAGHTLADALAWLARASGHEGTPLRPPSHELPPHPAEEGRRFPTPDPGATAEIARWFASSDAVLRAVAGRLRRSAPVRCWPHHFDIAILAKLPDEATVGIGMTPGDASYGEPYWYVTPWPYPSDPTLPPLAGGGRWHTGAWTGAVLPGTDLQTEGGPGTPADRLASFLDTAIPACAALAGGTSEELLRTDPA